jgi:hypothetical protein
MSGVLLVSEPGVDGVFRHVEALAHFLMNHGTSGPPGLFGCAGL